MAATITLLGNTHSNLLMAGLYIAVFKGRHLLQNFLAWLNTLGRNALHINTSNIEKQLKTAFFQLLI